MCKPNIFADCSTFYCKDFSAIFLIPLCRCVGTHCFEILSRKVHTCLRRFVNLDIFWPVWVHFYHNLNRSSHLGVNLSS
jgi:hypothetical protein